MAQKKGESAEKTTVRRIKATDDKSVKKPVKKTTSKKVASKAKKITNQTSVPEKTRNPFRAIGRYFKGAWVELKQVRWPTRANTWSMTGAVLLFTLIFIVLILLLDAGFKWIFEQILR